MASSVSSLAPGPKYVNVRSRDVFLVSLLYSKASLAFLCLIGLCSALNTALFVNQLGQSGPLCAFNNYLPYGNPTIRESSMPIVYYCRFLEFSVPITFLQLVLCILALFFGLNRRSMLFFSAYCFLWMMLFHGFIFFIFLYFLNYEKLIREVFSALLDHVLKVDTEFCQAMEPSLHCRMPNGTSSDIIADKCHTARLHHSQPLAPDCVQYSTAYLIDRTWLVAVALQYAFVIAVGIYATARAIVRYRRKRSYEKAKLKPNSARAPTNLIVEASSNCPSAVTL
uniref:G-protein coupled receptors family 1 profile domain-containing protein n=1 Tax=Panagrellus redivivus TaxID=6233 RepID=A0A7E4VUK3_PANRE